ncbi:MAG: protoporphyrin/coproporphyrin ferrochelatase [Frankiaceae bacterium]|nr:protoporphyrin/coproporphyrin ferrochelatase [Frankiaceae bacterium]
MTGRTPKLGLLVMAYGTPKDRGDVEAYYTDIRRGNPPPPHLLEELMSRYDAIGGTFPLRAITQAQVAALTRALADRGADAVVALGQKHDDPRVEDGVRELLAGGVDAIVGLVLAPHYSGFSIKQYADRAAAVASEAGVPITTIDSWHLLPAYLDFLQLAVADALAQVPDGSHVVFTAHSLPEKILIGGDPYPSQLQATAEAVAARLGLTNWSVGWQSAGRTADTWLGPDILDVVRAKKAEGQPGLVACACGFVADHLEVRFDLDVVAARVADEVGLPFARTRSLNDDAVVMAALAGVVLDEGARLLAR